MEWLSTFFHHISSIWTMRRETWAKRITVKTLHTIIGICAVHNCVRGFSGHHFAFVVTRTINSKIGKMILARFTHLVIFSKGYVRSFLNCSKRHNITKNWSMLDMWGLLRGIEDKKPTKKTSEVNVSHVYTSSKTDSGRSSSKENRDTSGQKKVIQTQKQPDYVYQPIVL